MARKQLPLNGEGQFVRFAAQLRHTRESTGLTLRKLAAVSGYAASTLSTAENGKKLPSWDVVCAYVEACGETDLASWRGWWDTANAQQTARAPYAQLAAESDAGHPGAATAAGPRRRAIIVTALVSVAVTAAGFLIFGRPAATGRLGAASVTLSGAARSPLKQTADGTDPEVAGCTAGSTTLGTAPVVLHQAATLHGRQLPVGTQVGTVALRYSPRCGGAWPRFDPTPGLNPDPSETGVGAVTIEAERPIDDTATIWKMGHIDRTYADLLLTGLGCVTAIARVDMVGQNATATGQTRCLPRT